MQEQKPNIQETIHARPLGWQIKFWREKRGFSQEELAEKTGLAGKQVVYQYESGRRIPNAEMIAKIATALHIRYHQFFTDDKI